MVDIVKERIEGDRLDDRITAQQADAQDLGDFDVRALHPSHVLRQNALDAVGVLILHADFARKGACASGARQTLPRMADIHRFAKPAANLRSGRFL